MGALHAILPGRNAPWRSAEHAPVQAMVPTDGRCTPPRYRPRDPRRTPLYRLFNEHFETFLATYEDHDESRYGPLGAHVERQVRAYLECGLYSAGCVRVRCVDCPLPAGVAASWSRSPAKRATFPQAAPPLMPPAQSHLVGRGDRR